MKADKPKFFLLFYLQYFLYLYTCTLFHFLASLMLQIDNKTLFILGHGRV